jgi:hypothetical protein
VGHRRRINDVSDGGPFRRNRPSRPHSQDRADHCPSKVRQAAPRRGSWLNEAVDPKHDMVHPDLIFRPPLRFGPGTPHTLIRASSDLTEELPKNGDVPMSPLPPIGGLGAIGGHNSNLKIHLLSRVPSATAYPHVRDSGCAHLRASQTA